MKAVVAVLAVGFVPALIVAWAFELTPEGLKRDGMVPPSESIAPRTARRMDRMLLVVSALALAYFGFDKFVLAPGGEIEAGKLFPNFAGYEAKIEPLLEKRGLTAK